MKTIDIKLEITEPTWARLIEDMEQGGFDLSKLLQRELEETLADLLVDLTMERWPEWAFKPDSEPIDELQVTDPFDN